MVLAVWWFKTEFSLEEDEKVMSEINGAVSQGYDRVKNYARENQRVSNFLESLDFKLDEPSVEEIKPNVKKIEKKIYNEGSAFKIQDLKFGFENKTRVIDITDELTESSIVGIEFIDLFIPWEPDKRKHLGIRIKMSFIEYRKDGSVSQRDMFKTIPKSSGNNVKFSRKDFDQRIHYDAEDTKDIKLSITVTPTAGGYITSNHNGFPKEITVKNILFTSLID